jgi:DNA-binding response OmpR family regulator
MTIFVILLMKKHSMDRKILVVDDETDIREILQFNLENAGYTVETAASAEEALEKLGPEHGLILLDVMMGGMSGYKMAEHLRKEKGNDIPIIFLTARTGQDDLLTGFNAGGDDYITKPFSIQEVVVRVRAVMKRIPKMEEPLKEDVVNAGDLKIDLEKKIVFIKGEKVVFSKKEFEVLSLLATHPGQIFSREDLISELWKDAPYVLERTVDVHIARIRSKLGECKNYLTNRSGYGYVFNAVE